MAAYYRGNNYKPYRSPRRSARKIGYLSEPVFWRAIMTIAAAVLLIVCFLWSRIF